MSNSRIETISMPTHSALVDLLCVHWMAYCRSWPANRPMHLALTGGRFARDFYLRLREVIQQQFLVNPHDRFPEIHYYWGDERCVGPEHPESNYRLAWETLLEPLRISVPHIHRIQAELSVPDALALAERDISTVEVVDHFPRLDLVFLGMGEDGHIASIFPGNTGRALREMSSYSHVVASKPPPSRITLNYGPLIRAGEVWCFASGAAKAEALRDSLASNSSTPLGILLQQRKHTRIYTDIVL
jgi:6-phosphogluconolactonase